MTVGAWGPTTQDNVRSGRGPHNEGGKLLFGAGGNQGGEGNDEAGEWWIDNVFEELDAENEFFYDQHSKRLYLIYNGTGSPPNQVVVPTLTNMIEMRGDKHKPVRNITLKG